MSDEIEDAKLEARIEAQEQYEDEREEFEGYLRDDGRADYSNGWLINPKNEYERDI